MKAKISPKTIVVSVVIFLLVVIVAVMGYVLLEKTIHPPLTEKEKFYMDRNAEMGVLPGMSREEIQERLNAVVAEGMMNVRINSEPVFEDGESEGNLLIENIEANHYDYRVTIELDDTGEEVYKSGIISPGYYVQNAKLEKPLPKGVYAATARFEAYEADEDYSIGSAALKLVLTVKN